MVWAPLSRGTGLTVAGSMGIREALGIGHLLEVASPARSSLNLGKWQIFQLSAAMFVRAFSSPSSLALLCW